MALSRKKVKKLETIRSGGGGRVPRAPGKRWPSVGLFERAVGRNV